MKITKFITAVFTAIFFALTSVSISAFAWENSEVSCTNTNFNYYDLNGDGRICVSDMVICRQNACKPVFEPNEVSEDFANNVMTAVDLKMLSQYILTGEAPEVSYIETSIDEMEPSAENLEQIYNWASGVIVDVEVGEVCQDSVRIRFLRDGTVSEISCERISETAYNLLHFDYEGRRITLGVTEEGLFAWDTYSFDTSPNNFNFSVKVSDEENEEHKAEKWEEPEHRKFLLTNYFTKENFEVCVPKDFDSIDVELESKLNKGEIYRFRITKVDDFHFSIEELNDLPNYKGREISFEINNSERIV